MTNVASIRRRFIQLLEDNPEGNAPGGMLELTGASFLADSPAIFGKPNAAYVEAELAWYLRESGTINDLQPCPAIWTQVAGPDGSINSHYGVLAYGAANGEQMHRVRQELLRDPASRRAVAIYTNPRMHDQATVMGRSDFVCTNAVQYLIRRGALETVVQMRSNDVVYGYRNDWAWQQYVATRLASSLGLPLGPMTWQAGSLHVYPRHIHLVK